MAICNAQFQPSLSMDDGMLAHGPCACHMPGWKPE